MLPALALLASFECNRCHEGVGPPAKLEKHCVRCHDAIRDGSWTAPAESMDAWRPNLVSFAAVPSLGDLSGFRRGWVASFLKQPHDVRPNLRGMMPRFLITDEDATRLAEHLVKQAESEPIPRFEGSLIAEGRRIFSELDCGSCHAYSGVLPQPREPTHAELLAMAPAKLLAPDLIHTRARLQPSFVKRFLADPKRARATALMPKFELAAGQVEALTAFVLAQPARPMEEEAVPARLPVLARPVSFAEVKQAVFEKACQHCHANPAKSFDDGGPGNTGGFGYRGKKLSLASYREVQSGSVGDDGRRRSIFTGQGDVPKIIAHLLARYQEMRGREVEGTIGMPMGLPPLSMEQIQLLESWIAQGRPN